MTDDEKDLAKMTADAVMKPLGDLVERLFGGAVDQIGGGWEDRLKARRQIRRIKLFLRIKAQLDEAGIKPCEIPEKIWLPALQGASLEDNETLQDKWAALLANAADPRNAQSVLPSFTTILAEFTARDAQFLDALYADATQSRRHLQSGDITAIRFREETLAKIYSTAGLSRTKPLIWHSQQFRSHNPELNADFAEFFVTLGTLSRHGLIYQTETMEFAKNILKAESVLTDPQVTMPNIKTERFYSLSELGVSFVRACQAPPRGRDR